VSYSVGLSGFNLGNGYWRYTVTFSVTGAPNGDPWYASVAVSPFAPVALASGSTFDVPHLGSFGILSIASASCSLVGITFGLLAAGFVFFFTPFSYLQKILYWQNSTPVDPYILSANSSYDVPADCTSTFVSAANSSGLFSYRMVEWQGIATGLTPGNVYHAIFTFELRPRGSGGAWSNAPRGYNIVFKAGAQALVLPWLAVPQLQIDLVTNEYRLKAVSIS